MVKYIKAGEISINSIHFYNNNNNDPVVLPFFSKMKLLCYNERAQNFEIST